MLLVKTRIEQSAIQGTGLFAAQFIPKGTTIWTWTPMLDVRLSQEELEHLSPPARETFLHYCFLSKRTGLYVLCFDNARFYNHSESPNVLDADSPHSEEGLDIAARDIQPGEELLCDYREFDNDIEWKLSRAEERAGAAS